MTREDFLDLGKNEGYNPFIGNGLFVRRDAEGLTSLAPSLFDSLLISNQVPNPEEGDDYIINAAFSEAIYKTVILPPNSGRHIHRITSRKGV